MINVTVEYNLTHVDVEFPCTEQMLEIKFNEMYRVEYEDRDFAIIKIREPEYLKVLEDQNVSLDRLNYLAKRLEGLCKSELNQFAAALKHYNYTNIKDLINLTFNLSKYTLISELGDMEKVGKTHIINLQGGLGIDEEEYYDFAAIGRELVFSGKGVVTEYGILFENEEIPFDEVYDGQVFPEYVYEKCLVVVELAYGEKTESVYLPCESMAIYKAQNRISVFDLGNCKTTLIDYATDHKEWFEMFEEILNTEGVYALNQVTKAVDSLESKDNMDKLLAILDYVDLKDSRTICVLAETMNSFTFIPKISNTTELAKYWTENVKGYELNPSLEVYFSYQIFGEYLKQEQGGKFTKYGYVCTNVPMEIEKVLEVEKELGPEMVGL